MRTFLAAFLIAFLTACSHSSHSDPIVVHRREILAPPSWLLEDCQSPPGDGSIGAELMRLGWLVQCERDSNAAAREWVEKTRRDGTASDGVAH